MDKIAFLGLGNMGAPMARRLIEAGYPVTVWNRTSARTVPLAEAGARVGGTPAETVSGADVVITMLADPAAVHDVAVQLAPALRPGMTLVEMSTIGPDAVHELAKLMPEGVTLIDAPVMGSVDAASAGKLSVLAGGDAKPLEALLSQLGSVTFTGELGTGAATKLVRINAGIGGVVLIGEVLALADALGLAEQPVVDALSRGPLAGATARAFSQSSHFPVALAAKDVALATSAADLPVLAAVRERLATFPDLASDDLRHVVDRIRGR
ncbi:MAG TPA: NAD(P)-dependent oxidoreductase [Micromonosporaceae bacterium]|jgi:3-hydroxyisobutyrate dehydrogenase